MLMLLLISLWTNSTGSVVDGDRVWNTVERHIYEKTGASRQELVVEMRGRLPKLVVSSGDYEVRVAGSAAHQFKGYVSIPIEVVCGGRVEQTANISVRIRTFGTVLVTGRLLPRHHDLAGEDVIPQHMETTSLPDDIMTDRLAIGGMRTVRMISNNCVLSRSMLESTPLVRRDDRVTLAVRSDKTVVTVQAIAKQDGRLGEVITLQKIDAYDQYRGKVVGVHAVEICLQEPRSIVRGN
jgi:flagella basal body P-ring formation protein FlgA